MYCSYLFTKLPGVLDCLVYVSMSGFESHLTGRGNTPEEVIRRHLSFIGVDDPNRTWVIEVRVVAPVLDVVTLYLPKLIRMELNIFNPLQVTGVI